MRGRRQNFRRPMRRRSGRQRRFYRANLGMAAERRPGVPTGARTAVTAATAGAAATDCSGGPRLAMDNGGKRRGRAN